VYVYVYVYVYCVCACVLVCNHTSVCHLSQIGMRGSLDVFALIVASLVLVAPLSHGVQIQNTYLQYTGPFFDIVFSPDPLEMPLPSSVIEETLVQVVNGVEYICYIPKVEEKVSSLVLLWERCV
jgi:hypothetical protein